MSNSHLAILKRLPLPIHQIKPSVRLSNNLTSFRRVQRPRWLILIFSLEIFVLGKHSYRRSIERFL